jgi:serine/threonine protein kinase
MASEKDGPGEGAKAGDESQEEAVPPSASPGDQATSGVSPVRPPITPADLRIGSVVNGKYRIDSILGRGAMGIVAECQHVELCERVALKFLLTTRNVTHDDLGVRFLREAQVSAKLRNEHIARVVDVGVWLESVPFMVMEYLDGHDLRAMIRRHGRLPPAVAIDFAIQICEGVAEAHAHGIVHRDLKPSNVFVTSRADGSDLVKILDFGISKWSLPDSDLGEGTETGIILGSPKYMSPEQIFASSKVDARADIWSLGAIAYEMLSGRPPFDMPTFAQTCAELSTDRLPPSISALLPEVPPALETAIFRCFERSVEKRTQNVAELAGALLEAVGSPFASVVRARIEATLVSRTGREGAPKESGSRIAINSFDAFPPAGLVAASGSTSQRSLPMTTDSSSRRQAEWQRPRRRRWVALAFGGMVVAGGAMAALSPSQSAAPSASKASVTASASAPPRPSSVTPQEPVSADPPSSADTAPEPSVEVRPRPRPAAVHPRPQPIAQASAAPTAPAPAPKATEPVKRNCDPPYVLSADGIKSYKPECF